VHRLREKEVMAITVIVTIAAEGTTEYTMAVGMIVTEITEALITAVAPHQLRLSMWNQRL
jgi:hypothetical protein